MAKAPNPDTISRSGLIAWFLGSLFFFVAFGLRVSPSVMVDELMRDFSVSAAVLGNLSAFYFYAYASIQIPVGVLMDRVEARKVMAIAAMVAAIGALVFASAPTVTIAYVGRLLIGLGCAFSWVGVLTVIGQQLPSRHYALFTGGGQFAGTAGAIAFQAPLAIAIESAGWRNSMVWIAGFTAILAVAIWFLCSRRANAVSTNGNLLDGLRLAARNRQTWIAAVIGMSLTGPVLAFAGLWGVPWFKAVYDMDKGQAATLLVFVFIGWLTGAPVVGWLSDKFQTRKRPLVIGTLVSTLAITTVLYAGTLSAPALCVLLYFGGLGGSSMILTFAIAREHNPPGASGATLGIVNTFVVASGAVFQPLIGWLLDLNWDGTIVDGIRRYSADDYSYALMVLPLFATVGFVLSLLLKEPRRTRTP